jgi:hypothetical protein
MFHVKNYANALFSEKKEEISQVKILMQKDEVENHSVSPMIISERDRCEVIL